MNATAETEKLQSSLAEIGQKIGAALDMQRELAGRVGEEDLEDSDSDLLVTMLIHRYESQERLITSLKTAAGVLITRLTALQTKGK